VGASTPGGGFTPAEKSGEGMRCLRLDKEEGQGGRVANRNGKRARQRPLKRKDLSEKVNGGTFVPRNDEEINGGRIGRRVPSQTVEKKRKKERNRVYRRNWVASFMFFRGASRGLGKIIKAWVERKKKSALERSWDRHLRLRINGKEKIHLPSAKKDAEEKQTIV